MVVKCFGFSPAISLQDFHYHKIIRTEIRERGNDGGPLILIVFGCIINAVIRQMWPSTGILIVMEACLVMICVAAGVLEFFLEEATTSLGRIIRS